MTKMTQKGPFSDILAILVIFDYFAFFRRQSGTCFIIRLISSGMHFLIYVSRIPTHFCPFLTILVHFDHFGQNSRLNTPKTGFLDPFWTTFDHLWIPLGQNIPIRAAQHQNKPLHTSSLDDIPDPKMGQSPMQRYKPKNDPFLGKMRRFLTSKLQRLLVTSRTDPRSQKRSPVIQ